MFVRIKLEKNVNVNNWVTDRANDKFKKIRKVVKREEIDFNHSNVKENK